MKKSLFLLPILLLTSCQQKPQGPSQFEYDLLKAERDSLSSHMTELQDIIGSVTTSLDSIDTQESLLFVNNNDGTKATKRQILERINSYKELLARQREQLANLEKQESSNKASVRELKAIITRLRQEISDKEQTIAQLEKDLTTTKKDVVELQAKLEHTQIEVENNAKEIDVLQQIATAQDEIINTGYFIVATKSELKDLGLVKGVFKKKADYANLDTKKFTKIDIREFTELIINGTPRLITEKPENSYLLTDNGDGTWTLRIKTPADFWESSQFLIIQTK